MQILSQWFIIPPYLTVLHKYDYAVCNGDAFQTVIVEISWHPQNLNQTPSTLRSTSTSFI